MSKGNLKISTAPLSNEILVTGASGFIGQALVRYLCTHGHTVTVLSRKLDMSFPLGVRSIRGDLLDPSSLPPNLFFGVKVIFHCAGEIKDPLIMRRLHVDSTARLLDLAFQETVGKSLPPIRWVQLSSVGAYGQCDHSFQPRIVTETSPVMPKGDYEITKTEADRLLQAASKQGKISLTILRPSNVFGSGMSNRSLSSLIKIVRRGLFFYIGSRETICNYVHVDDVARALFICANSNKAIGKIYNLSNDCQLTELVNAVADSCGRNRPRMVVPEYLVRFLTGIFGGRSFWPLTSSRVDALVSRTQYPSDLLHRELGFTYSRPVPMSVLELIE
jgi:nucleoside-diphosphate-sugar epimerase